MMSTIDHSGAIQVALTDSLQMPLRVVKEMSIRFFSSVFTDSALAGSNYGQNGRMEKINDAAVKNS